VTCCSSKFMPFNITILTVAALGFVYNNIDTDMLDRTWSSSIHFVTYEIYKFCHVFSFSLIVLKSHYDFSTPTCITLTVTDVIMYFTIHLSSWWRMMKCGFYLLWSFTANWDLRTSINFQERLQHVHMLWWWENSCLYSEGLSVFHQEKARCVIWLLKCMIIRSKYPNIIQYYTHPLDLILIQPMLNSLWMSKIFCHLTHCMMSRETSNPKFANSCQQHVLFVTTN
jgi:hypothetical protein